MNLYAYHKYIHQSEFPAWMTTRPVCIRGELVTPRPGGEVSREWGAGRFIHNASLEDARHAGGGGRRWGMAGTVVPQIKSRTSEICVEGFPRRRR